MCFASLSFPCLVKQFKLLLDLIWSELYMKSSEYLIEPNHSQSKVAKHSKVFFHVFKILWMMYILFPFRLKGIYIIQDAVYYGLSAIFVLIYLKKLFDSKRSKKIAYSIFSYLVIFSCLIVMAGCIPFFKHTYDYSYLSNYLYYLGRIFILTGSLVLADNIKDYLLLTVRAICFYVICSLFLLIRPLHDFYLTILVSSSLNSTRFEDFYSQDYWTRFGLQGFSGFNCTIMCSIGILYCCLLLVKGIESHKSVTTKIILTVICLIGNLMYGRSGFIVSMFLIALTFIYLALRYGKFQILIILFIVFLVLSFIFVINEKQLEQIPWVRWMFEGFFNYLDYGTFSTTSSSDLQSMYIRPSLQTFFYGDGYYTVAGAYYMGTDVGFLRPLFFFGIFGEILYYSLLLPELHAIKFILRKHDYIFFDFLCLVFIICFEFKGEILLTFSTTLYSLMGVSLLTNSKLSKEPGRQDFEQQ